jgi:hypothetical protein
MARLATGSKDAARDSPLWACKTTPPAKFWRHSSFPLKLLSAISFYGDRSGIFVRHDDSWTIPEELTGKRQPTQFGRALDQLGSTFIAAQSPQTKGRVERLWGYSKIALAAKLRLAAGADLDSANTVRQNFNADYNCRLAKSAPLGVRLLKILTASVASSRSAWPANTTPCSGRASAFRSPNKPAASVSLTPKFTSTQLSTDASVLR